MPETTKNSSQFANPAIENNQNRAETSIELPAANDNLLKKIAELEKRLLDQDAVMARINQLEHKIAPQKNSLVTPPPTILPSRGHSTSRRKLLKGLGFAAATLAAGATVLSPKETNTALAASGDFVVQGNSNLSSDATYLSQTGSAPGDGVIFWADWNPTAKSSAPGSSAKAGVAGTSSEGIGGYFQGATAPILLAPASSGTGAPTGSNHSKGELYVDSAGDLFICQSSGTPGSWVKVNGGGGSSGGGSGSYVSLQSSAPPTTRDSGNIGITGVVDTTGKFRAVNSGNTSELQLGCGSDAGSSYLSIWNGSTSYYGSIYVSSSWTGIDHGDVQVYNNLNVAGAISKGSGSFVIPHPDPAKSATTDLRHCFVEAPTRGENIYRFSITATQAGQVVTISLPSYWPFLNENPQVWVSAKGHYGRGYGDLNSTLDTLRVTCELAGSYNVLLVGTRKDDIAKAWWDEFGAEKPVDRDWVSPNTDLTPSTDRTKEVVRTLKNKNREGGKDKKPKEAR